MNKKQKIMEATLVATIMADCIPENLYPVIIQNANGSFSVFEHIVRWTIEFLNENKKTNWDKELTTGIKPRSRLHPVIKRWDHAVEDYAYFKIGQLTRRN